ncbi:MAG: NDP-sugar synthase [Candidatus Melainabacteria bacterium]|nr:NDP-sugar synthase [Candidatus Melainabacteria bacterium]
MNSHNQAMILAAGVGSRLDPLTTHIPKPLCPILGKPVMEHIIDLCVKHGFTNLAANTHVHANKVSDYFKDANKKFGVNLNLVYEKDLTGIAGGIRSCKKYLTNDVILIIMGDALTDLDLSSLYEEHIKGKCPVTIGIKEVEDTSQFGVVVTDKNNKVISFQEKPKPNEAKSNLANTGIYFFSQEILNEIPSEKEAPKYDVATDLFQKLMAKNIPMQAINIHAYWADIGTLKNYRKGIQDSLDEKVKIDISALKTNFGYREKGVSINSSARINGKVYMAENVKIESNVKITGLTYIEKNCTIKENSYIDNSIIWANSYVGSNVKIINSILGNDCKVKENTEMISNSVWAPETIIEGGTKPSIVFG